MRSLSPFFFAITLLYSAPVSSEDTLGEIVVTATRIESSVRNVGRSITVVKKDRIQKNAQQLGLDEALAGVPGLYSQNRYNFAQDLRISLRGFGARSNFGVRGIRIFVDGIPETLPDGQTSVDNIDIGSAQKIEVLRGPASSLYGNASGGVIAIESELGADPAYVEGRVAGGEYGYSQAQLKSVGTIGSSDYLVSASRTELDGYRHHSSARGSTLNARIRQSVDKTDDLTISLNLTDQPLAHDPGGMTALQATEDPSSARAQNILFDSGESIDQQRIGLVYRRMRTEGNLTLRSHFVWRDFANKLPFVDGGSVDLDRFFYGFGAQYDTHEILADTLRLSIGAEFGQQNDVRRRYNNNSGSIGDLVFDQQEQVDNAGLYLQAQYELDTSWSLLGGLRYDEVSYVVVDQFLADDDGSGRISFKETSPSLALNYRMDNGVIFASYSNGFDTPTTTELANPDATGGFNPTIKPQTADSIELGYKYARKALYFELAWFTIEIEGELIPFELAEFPGRSFYSNAGSSTRDGVETAANWSNKNGWRIDASYTWSDFHFDNFVNENGDNLEGKRMPGLPEHFAYLGVSYEGGTGLSAALMVNYSGDLYADNANTANVSSYTVANFRVAYEFQSGSWMMRPYVGINNLFDESYNSNIRINAYGGRFFEPAPERHYYAGIVIRFTN